MDFNACEQMLEGAVKDKIAPCVAAVVGTESETLFSYEGGVANLQKNQPYRHDMLFDMASLSKILVTTPLALIAIDEKRLFLQDTLGSFFGDCGDKGDITVFDLLTHQSGLSPHIPLYLKGISPDEAIDYILSSPLDYPSRTEVKYSCMGFILIGEIIQRIFDKPLDEAAQEMVFSRLGMENSCYRPQNPENCVATEAKENGECRQGSVHDENARFLGGVAGNAGVFSTIDDSVLYAKWLLKKGEGLISEGLFEKALYDYTTNFSEDRGLGFQLNSFSRASCGPAFSPQSFGHTGFTGTSIYVDLQHKIYSVLLANRVHPTRDNQEFIIFRRQYHQEIISAITKDRC